MERKLNQKAAKLRCDNGREYANEYLKNWCKSEGIEIDFTTPHTPQLNGKAERINRTIMEKARALIFDSKMSKTMWGKAVYVASYLHNRSPTKATEVTPIKKWSTKRPQLKNIKLFGCDAYAKVLGPLKKLDEKSQRYKFVGYAPTEYRLWDSRKKKIVTTKDVRFSEKTERSLKERTGKEDWTQLETEKLEEDMDGEEEDRQRQEELVEQEEEEPNETAWTETTENSDEELNLNILRKSQRNRKIPERYQDYALLTYREAITGDDKEKWIAAIKNEKDSLEKNKTWTLVDSSKLNNVKPLNSKWVFTVKGNSKHKARLVVKGCEQR